MRGASPTRTGVSDDRPGVSIPPRVNADALEVARRLPPALAAALRRRLEEAETAGIAGLVVVQLKLDPSGRVARRGHVIQPPYDHV